MPVLLYGLNGFPGSCDRLVYHFFCVRNADETCFKLRRSEINTFIQHRMKEPAIKFTVAAIRRLPIRHLRLAKKAGPHGTNAVCDGLDSCVRGDA